jgi:hypothetical protein
MRALVDLEMTTFRDLDIRVVFLQNIVTDLLLGLGLNEFFVAFANHIRKRYQAQAGFITMNLPSLAMRLAECDMQDAVLCAAINRIGYQMSPNKEAYDSLLGAPGRGGNQVIAMSIFASGAIPPRPAIEYIRGLSIDSVVFGASNARHIRETYELLKA